MKTLSQTLGTSGVREGNRRGKLLGGEKREEGDKSTGMVHLAALGGGRVRDRGQKERRMRDSGGCCHRVEKGKWGS